MNFLAIDTETASYYRYNACSVGLVRIKNNIIIEKVSYLIRPPSKWFVFTDLHRIVWDDVKDEPNFGKLCPTIKHLFRKTDFLVAHNASFDRSGLNACCERYQTRIINNLFNLVCNYLLLYVISLQPG